MPYPLIYMSMAAFMLQCKTWEIMTENVWPTKPKIITMWPFAEKAYWFLFYMIMEQQERRSLDTQMTPWNGVSYLPRLSAYLWTITREK